MAGKKKKKLMKACLWPKKCLWRFFSTASTGGSFPRSNQPLLLSGKGVVKVGRKVMFGYASAPGFLDGSINLNCRDQSASIVIEDGVKMSNNVSMTAVAGSITVGESTLIGHRTEIYDNDFHGLLAHERDQTPASVDVKIGRNCFVGSNVTILKGVEIGDNSVIASGSLVNRSIPANVLAGGVPAKVIKQLEG